MAGVNLKDKNSRIATFTELYEQAVDPPPAISSIITGHLVIEFLLRNLVNIYDPKLKKISEELTHKKLIGLNFEIGTISPQQKEVLDSINKIRNKFAHEITYRPTLNELKTLFTKASKAFSDMTDGIVQELHEIENANNILDLDEWVILELFVQIAYDLHLEYLSRGGDLEGFNIPPTPK